MALADLPNTKFRTLSTPMDLSATSLRAAREGFEEMKVKPHTLIISERDVEEFREERTTIAQLLKTAGFTEEIQTYAIIGIKGFILFGEGLMVISEGE